MELKILGINTKDKGKQLETLTATILKHQGFTSISTNEITTGGSEIDVTAFFTHPSFTSQIKTEVVCECKAYNQETDITSWLKFLGKIFTKEISGAKVIGFFIALSGTNGNVRGHFRDIQKSRNDIQLVSGEDLVLLLREISPIIEYSKLVLRISEYTSKVMTGTQLCYYEKNLFWFITFENSKFSIIGSDGSLLKSTVSKRIETILSKSESLEYLDLKGEVEAKERTLMYKKIILDVLLDNRCPLALDEIWDKYLSNRYETNIDNTSVIEEIILTLVDECLVIKSDEKYILKVFTSTCSSMDKIRLYHAILDQVMIYNSLKRKAYQELIDIFMVNEILLGQGGIDLTEDEIGECVKLLSWSPSALMWSLNKDEFLFNSKNPTQSIDGTRKDYFFQNILKCLDHDFKRGELKEYFKENCKIVEVETEVLVNIKSNVASLFESRLNERIGLFPLSPELGGQLALIRLLPESGQPWDHSTEKRK